MATTNFSINHPLARKVWSARLFREALKETFCSRFMGETKDSLIYVKKDLNKGAGDTIYYGLRMQLAAAGILGDNTLEGNEEALTTYRDQIVVDQLRHAVRSAGEMSEQRVPFSVREESKDGLRDWWADRIDTAFFNQIGGNVTNAAPEYTGNNTVTAPSSGRRLVGCNNGIGGASVTASLTFTNTASASLLEPCLKRLAGLPNSGRNSKPTSIISRPSPGICPRSASARSRLPRPSNSSWPIIGRPRSKRSSSKKALTP